MNCPNCGGDTWDNAQKVAGGWKGPLRKCKAGCGWVEWPPKGQRATSTTRSAPSGPKWTWDTLRTTYRRSLVMATKEVRECAESAKLTLTVADILASAATIFIAASRDGVGEAPAPKPEPESPDGY